METLAPFKPLHGVRRNMDGEVIGYRINVRISGIDLEICWRTEYPSPEWVYTPNNGRFPGIYHMADLIRLVWFICDGDIEAKEELPDEWVETYIEPIQED